MAVFTRVGNSQQGLSVIIEYNAGNKRITQISWSVADGYRAIGKVWNNGNLVFERNEVGPTTGSQNVAGNIQLTEIEEHGQTTLVLPSNIMYEIGVHSR